MGNHAITSAERIGHVLPRAGVVADKLGYLKGISLFYSLGSDTRGHTKLKLWGFLDKISALLRNVRNIAVTWVYIGRMFLKSDAGPSLSSVTINLAKHVWN